MNKTQLMIVRGFTTMIDEMPQLAIYLYSVFYILMEVLEEKKELRLIDRFVMSITPFANNAGTHYYTTYNYIGMILYEPTSAIEVANKMKEIMLNENVLDFDYSKILHSLTYTNCYKLAMGMPMVDIHKRKPVSIRLIRTNTGLLIFPTASDSNIINIKPVHLDNKEISDNLIEDLAIIDTRFADDKSIIAYNEMPIDPKELFKLLNEDGDITMETTSIGDVNSDTKPIMNSNPKAYHVSNLSIGDRVSYKGDTWVIVSDMDDDGQISIGKNKQVLKVSINSLEE